MGVIDRVLATGFAARPLVITDAEGKIMYCNDTGAEALQVHKGSAAIGQTLKSLVSLKSHKIVDEVISHTIETAHNLVMPLVACHIRQRMANAKGSHILDLNWIATARFDSDGHVLGVVLQLQAFPLLGIAVAFNE